MQSHRNTGPRSPLIVGVGGSSRAGSGTDIALLAALKAAERAGASTRFFGGQFLAGLPLYDPASVARTAEQSQLVEAIRVADGVIVATPAYHGNVSSLVKNALDLLEDLREDVRPYLHDRAVACVVTGAGPQAAGMTLMALRGTIHALRGWPTPLGVCIDSGVKFNLMGHCADPKTSLHLETAGRQVLEFAVGRALYHDSLERAERAVLTA